MVYPKFISFVHREVTVEQLLPYGQRLDMGSDESALSSRPSTEHLDILIEPSQERLVDYLIRVWMAQRIYDIFWESKLSEWASRVIHLEESSQAASEINKKLQFSYFSSLHQISDKNIREIVASRLLER